MLMHRQRYPAVATSEGTNLLWWRRPSRLKRLFYNSKCKIYRSYEAVPFALARARTKTPDPSSVWCCVCIAVVLSGL
jgi:hypothetical protein